MKSWEIIYKTFIVFKKIFYSNLFTNWWNSNDPPLFLSLCKLSRWEKALLRGRMEIEIIMGEGRMASALIARNWGCTTSSFIILFSPLWLGKGERAPLLHGATFLIPHMKGVGREKWSDMQMEHLWCMRGYCCRREKSAFPTLEGTYVPRILRIFCSDAKRQVFFWLMRYLAPMLPSPSVPTLVSPLSLLWQLQIPHASR